MSGKWSVALPGVLLLAFAGCVTPQRNTATFTLGDTQIRALVSQWGAGGPTLINVHDDENTSVVAGKNVLRKSRGRLIELAHSGQRFVGFGLGGATYHFDPNRIFSDEGIRATLGRRSRYSEEAAREVKRFASAFLARFALDLEPVIVALHNTDGRGLTINSYLPASQLSSASSQVHVSPQRSPGDFFYVTDRRFFDYLTARDFNVMLQDDANVPDDGSLSVYFARRGIPYVNVEADVKHLNEQTEMVHVVRQMVDELKLTASKQRQ